MKQLEISGSSLGSLPMDTLSASTPAGAQWDYEFVWDALRSGKGVESFVADLEANFQEVDFHEMMINAPTADEGWERWISTVYGVAERHFSRTATLPPLWCHSKSVPIVRSK